MHEPLYQVRVGGERIVFTVYEGHDPMKANKKYHEFVKLSAGDGAFAKATVAMLRNGEVVNEHNNQQEE